MENDKLIAQLRSVSVETGSLVCLGCGHENNCGIHGCAILRAAADCIEGLSTQLAELQTRFDRVNDFEQSQCAKVMVKLAERDAQLAAAVEALESVAHSGGNFCEFCGSDCCDAGLDDPDTFQCGCFKWRVVQEASTQTQASPAWAEQFERRFIGWEDGG